MKKNTFFRMFGLVLLAFVAVFAACDMEVVIKEAGKPEIISQPVNRQVTIPYGQTSITLTPPLTVDAKSPDGGTLSYTWYSYMNDNQYKYQRGTSEQDGQEADFSPLLTVGQHKYYVLVTNTNNKARVKTASAQSVGITVSVNVEGAAVYPHITVEPQDKEIFISADMTVAPLTATATISDAGTLSWQWYEHEDADDEEGEAISTATGNGGSAAFTPDFTTATAAGIYYYSVVFTNDNPAATGMPTATSRSDVVSYEVNRVASALEPVINTHPADANYYTDDDTTRTLTVIATSPDGGELSYQWYSSTTSATAGFSEAGVGASINFVPSSDGIRTIYYYVVVTNTNQYATQTTAMATSRTATVDISERVEGTADFPNITAQPQSKETFLSANMNPAPLTATATVSDGGILSWKWYTHENASDQEGEVISTATGNGGSATFTPPFTSATAVGIYYYSVVFTNYNVEATGKPTETSRSSVVGYEVKRVASAVTPTITTQPASASYFTTDTGKTLTVTAATPSDGGVLSYRWWRSTTSATSGFSEVSGTAGAAASISLTTNAVSTTYYYVVVTNTNQYATQTTATATSSTATIAVTVRPPADPTPNNTITVSLTKQQYVRGFGVMDTPWNNVKALTMTDYDNLFNPNVFGYNILRMMITAHNTNYNTTLDQLIAGTLVHGNEGYLSRPDQVNGMIRANSYGAYILASPWSPPAAWKTNNSWNGGGSLRTTDYGNYANYLKSVARIYAERGAPIYAVSIQNEPNFTATYEGCEWSDNQMRDFFASASVGHFTDGQAGWGDGRATPYVLTMSGESANTPTIHNAALGNTTARANIDLLARHQYGNVTTTLSNLYGKEMWMTEMNKNSGSGGYNNDSKWEWVWKFMNYVDVSIRINKENAYIWWTGKRFYSVIGDGDYGTTQGALLPRGWGLAHYARFANDTGRVTVTASGSNSSSVNSSTFTEDSSSVKISAFVKLNDAFYDAGVIDRNTRWTNMNLGVSDIKAITLVMFTPSGGTGTTGGTNMQTVKIQLPSGFTIGSAEARKSDSSVKMAVEPVTIGGDGNCAYVTLPARTILSVRLDKAE